MVVANVDSETTLAVLAINEGIGHAIFGVNIAPTENIAFWVIIEIKTFLCI